MNYAELKAIIARKNLAWQYDEQPDHYNLWARDGQDRYEATVYKASATIEGLDREAEAANLADFEENYKANANFAIGTRTYPFSTPDVQFAGKGFDGLARHGETTDIWVLLADGYYLTGGEYWTFNAAKGDKMDIDIVDKDGLYTPSGTVLIKPPHMWDWNVLPKDAVLTKFERTYAGKPPPGVYLRLRYLSTGLIDVDVYGNLYLHKPL